MRYSIPLLMFCSGLMVATSTLSVQVAVAGQNKVGTQVVAALDSQVSPMSEGSTKAKVVCSHNRTLQVSADGTKVAALPEGLTWASNIVQLFCREVRINMILVKDYCAVIR